ncbi:hypothetical protein HDA32_005766 [Spinactinospora alkalitolerans]|uniref:Uncharacterized protein n=1 Tax=Spinactinospora alkalitolerans TaxID=687207 RepID=A0A852U1B7_9ACTN|nr:hypothetical protein [Spinactinospora alkalitolerans]NYE50646.1 hypothetical protein [Spinactinospora alkalitolerans]
MTFAVCAALDDGTQTGTYHGLWQRISLGIGLGWFGVLALRLLFERPRVRSRLQEAGP